jgi:signal transduction histidine kinase/DNA-binding response OmpR family regulator
MRKPRKATFNILLFVIAFLLLLIGIIIYTQYYSQKNIKLLREANQNASSTFEINNRLQELVYYVESTELYAREQHKNPTSVSKESLLDTLSIINGHLDVLKKQKSAKIYADTELDGIVNLVNTKLNFLTTFIKNDEIGIPQKYNANQIDQLLAVSINDSLYNKVLIFQQELENNLKKTFVETNSYSEKVLRLDTLLAIIFILALAILGTLIIKRLLDQLSLIYKLAQEKERADTSANVKEQFLANMSHEIRTPINAVVGFAGLLQKTTLDEKQKQFVGLIQNSGENLLSVVNDILDISKIEAGMMRITKHPFSVNEVCTSLEMMFSHKVTEKKLGFVLDYDKNIPENILGDSERLNQVLINLLNNAIKFTEHGFIKLSARLINKTEKDIKIEFVVKDSGIGISKEKQETVFERFEQADNNTARQYGGTGLGLAIVEKIIDMQGGEIKVDSVLGVGTTFTATLIYDLISDTEIVSASNNNLVEKNAIQKEFGAYHILVAEDNKTNQTLLKFMLQQWNLKYDLAENGQQVLDKIKEKQYDLILMDIQMPILDGYEAAKRVRKDFLINTPIIAMTAHVLPTEKQKCIDAGMNDYISKPLDENIFLQMLEKYLNTAYKKKKAENAPIVKNVSFEHIDINYLNKVFSFNKEFIHEILTQFKIQYGTEVKFLKNAVEQKDKKETLKLTHHMKTTVSSIMGDNVLKEYLDSIDVCMDTENWMHINESLNKMLEAEPILIKEINQILNK